MLYISLKEKFLILGFINNNLPAVCAGFIPIPSRKKKKLKKED